MATRLVRRRRRSLLALLALAAGSLGPALPAAGSVGGPPGPPVLTTLVVDGLRLDVTWEEPASSLPITQYLVQAVATRPDGTVHRRAAQVLGSPPATTATLVQLQPGLSYQLSVSARSAEGTGPAAVWPEPVDIARLPEAPVLTAVVSNGPSADVAWDAPASDVPITQYLVEAVATRPDASVHRRTVQLVGSPPATAATVTKLETGLSYQVSVRARSAVGLGPAAVWPDPVGVATVPAAPLLTSLVLDGRQATLAWTAPASPLPITRYVIKAVATRGDGSVHRRSVQVVGSPPATSGVVARLEPGLTYQVSVLARSAVGAGPAAVWPDPVVVGRLPEAPVLTSAVADNTRLLVGWDAPASDLPITSYLVQAVATRGDGTVHRRVAQVYGSPPATSATVVGLEAGRSYEVSVLARSAVGSGPAAVWPTLVPPPPVVSGELLGWGSNDAGRTGLGTDVGKTLSPAAVGSASDWTDVSAGTKHTLAVRADGTLWAWGANDYGATGLGTDVGTTLVPTQVGTGTDWVAVAAGVNHSLALRADGTLWAWGANYQGRTGLGLAGGTTLVPTQVGTGTDWVAVAAGVYQSLGLRADGTLWAWGDNFIGSLGLGSSVPYAYVPTQVGTGTDWTAVSAGAGFQSMGIRADGTLWAWGANTFGSTGLGTAAGGTFTPTQVGTSATWSAVSVGRYHSLGIRADGTLWSWGNNADGRTGLGLSTDMALVPTQVGVDTDWAAVSAGGVHSLGLRTDGSLWAWGSNADGATGLGTEVGATLVPTRVGTGTAWIAVAAGDDHSFTIGEPPPPPPNEPPVADAGPAQTVTSGDLVALDGTGSSDPESAPLTFAWVQVEPSNPTVPLPDTDPAWVALSDPAASQPTFTAPQVAASTDLVFRLTVSDGALTDTDLVAVTVDPPARELWAWGTNASARTGLGTTVGATLSPTAVGSSADWRSVSAAIDYSLAVRTDGTLWAWGNNRLGITGLGTDVGTTTVPTQVGTASNWIAAVAGDNHSLGLRADGTLWAWGYNGNGRTGLGVADGNTLVPTQVGTATNWAAIDSGPFHSLGLRADGTMWSWGSHAQGATGQGTDIGEALVPTQIGTRTDWKAISSGGGLSNLAIRTDGTLWSWGFNLDGRTGLGTTTGATLVPTQVGDGTDWARVDAGGIHSFGIRTDGTLWAWGSNVFGRTGLGLSSGSTVVPTQVGTDTNWSAVAAGGYHSLGVRTDGTLWSWGSNFDGRTGLGTSSGSTLAPTRVGTGTRWITVAAGDSHSFAIGDG